LSDGSHGSRDATSRTGATFLDRVARGGAVDAIREAERPRRRSDRGRRIFPIGAAPVSKPLEVRHVSIPRPIRVRFARRLGRRGCGGNGRDGVISVILPVRDGAPWIAEALGSLLSQRHMPGEILVGDDASSDGTPEIVEALGSPLVSLVRSSTPLGVSRQCNLLVQRARGRYIARMDADDIALPDRFQAQMRAFANSDVSVLGTWARRFGLAETLHPTPVTDAECRAEMAFSCPFVNPTVVYDRQRLGADPEWDPEVRFGGDFDQFARLRGRARFGNLPRVLLLWRLHESNVGRQADSLADQRRTVERVRNALWSESGIRLDPAEIEALDRLVFLPLPELADSASLLSAFGKALDHDQASLWAPRSALRETFRRRWDYYCLSQAWGRPGVVSVWWTGNRRLRSRRSMRTLCKLGLKSLLPRRPA